MTKVIAEGADGSFCLLPRHVDFVSALVPGLLAYEEEAGGEQVLAADAGVLVKCGDEVLVSVRNAIGGKGLEELKDAVRTTFSNLDDREKKARTVLARLEADFIRRCAELQERI